MSNILDEFDAERALYQAFTTRIVQTLSELLINVKCHSITERVKDKQSLENKIKKNPTKYTLLGDVTDISGVRITTYFDDDVNKIAELIENEFEIDHQNTVDKKGVLDPERFGYVSLHHVVSFKNDRCQLRDFKRFEGLKVEIQTRTILQHAWAEIEHDLGYKTKAGIPKSVRRRFSRLAGLLELADQEFLTIRKELDDYSHNVSHQISINPQIVSIDFISLKSFMSNAAIVTKVERAIVAGVPNLKSRTAEDFIADSDVRSLLYLQIESIEQLESLYQIYERKLIDFSILWMTETSPNLQFHKSIEVLHSGVSVFYLLYIVAAERDTLPDFIASNFTTDETAIPEIVTAVEDTLARL